LHLALANSGIACLIPNHKHSCTSKYSRKQTGNGGQGEEVNKLNYTQRRKAYKKGQQYFFSNLWLRIAKRAANPQQTGNKQH
jgi:hypothetical protein